MQTQKRWIWPFELEEQIGSGAMGVVYRAHVKNDRRVALKLLPPEVKANSSLSARFVREMEVLKNLKHPNIVHCFGGTSEGDDLFYAMELIEGGSIHSLILKHGKLTWQQTVKYGIELCAALEHAHKQGVIHRDIKPANVLISKSGRTKLSDFGLALVTSESRLTASGKTLGTMHYMAPEQIRGSDAQSNRTDLYALGCTFFEMLTGKPPFSGNSLAAILNKHLKEDPPRVSTIIDVIPEDLDQLVADLLEKNPDRRPASAAEVGIRLEKISLTPAINAASTATPVGNAAVSTSRFTPPPASTLPKISYSSVGSHVESSATSWFRTLVVAAAAALIAGFLGYWYGVAGQQHIQQILIQQLNDPSREVRLTAIRTLGEFPQIAVPAVPRLTELLQQTDNDIQAEAIMTLGKIGPPAADASMRLRAIQQQNKEGFIRQKADETLQKIGTTPARFGYWQLVTWGIILAFLSGAAYWGFRLYREYQESKPNAPRRSLFG